MSSMVLSAKQYVVTRRSKERLSMVCRLRGLKSGVYQRRTVANKVWIQLARQRHIGERPRGDQDQLPRVLTRGLHQFDDSRT